MLRVDLRRGNNEAKAKGGERNELELPSKREIHKVACFEHEKE